MSETIRIGTRGSELALRQARLVASELSAQGIASELITYTTVGDTRLDEPLSAIGGKGLFTEELEADLRDGRTQLVVHSLKDLPTESPPGLIVAAVLEREDARDALLIRGRGSDSGGSLDDVARGARVGTSSLRRRALLLAQRPDLDVVDLRGNVPTRIRKLQDGLVDAAILAAAGLHRLGERAHITCYLDAPAWLPAAGQGAIAVQVRSDDQDMRALVSGMNHAETMYAVTAERAFLAGLEGGCQAPIGALAIPEGEQVMLHGVIADVTGATVIRGSIAIDRANPASSGEALAQQLRGEGATRILAGLLRAGSATPVQRD